MRLLVNQNGERAGKRERTNFDRSLSIIDTLISGVFFCEIHWKNFFMDVKVPCKGR